MKLPIITAIAIMAGASPGLAADQVSRCVLEVKGVRYLDAPCNFEADADGSFRLFGLTEGVHANPYFVYVFVEGPDEADGYWNGTPPTSHAQDKLGLLRRDGACWNSESARVCAYR